MSTTPFISSYDKRQDEEIETTRRVFKDYDVRAWFRRKKGIPAATLTPQRFGTGTNITPYSGHGYAGQAGFEGYTPRKACVHKGTKVYTFGDPKGAMVEVYAVQSPLIRTLHRESGGIDLWIPLNAFSAINGFVSSARPTNPQAAQLWDELKAADLPPFIGLDWPDGGLPPLPAKFLWPTLVGSLFKQAKTKLSQDGVTPFRVAFSCVGSHGRTGTALVALLIAIGVPAQTALDQVRGIHCEECVETKAQEEYIKFLDDEIKPAKMDFAVKFSSLAKPAKEAK